MSHSHAALDAAGQQAERVVLVQNCLEEGDSVVALPLEHELQEGITDKSETHQGC